MKILALILCLALPVLAQDEDELLLLQASASTGGGGGGGPASFSDDFNRSNTGDPGANWLEINTANFETAGNSMVSPSTAGFDERAIVWTNNPCTTANQYVKVTVSGPSAGNGAGVIFRHTTGGAYYQVQFDEDDNAINWKYFPTAGGTAVLIQSSFFQTWLVYPVTVGVVVTGTGNSTEIRIWNAPTANAPTSVSSWDGSGALVTLTDNPATAVDSGPHVGLGINDTSSGSNATWDDFFGGDVP